MTTKPAGQWSYDDLRQIASDPNLASCQVLDLLEVIRSEEEEELCALASDALQTIEVTPELYSAPMAKLCTDPHEAVAAWSCKLSSRLDKCTDEHQAAITKTLVKHPSTYARQQAALALGNLTTLKSESIEALQTAANSDDPRLSRLAKQTLASAQAA